MPQPQDSRAIEKLLYSYAERIDSGDFPGVADLFRHGRIEAAPGFMVEGAAAVQKLYERTTRLHEDGTPRTRHVTTNVIVEFGADSTVDTAEARSYFTVFQQTETIPLQAIIAGHYVDTFHVVDDQWCFDTRQIFIDLTGDLSAHLLISLD